MDDALYVAATGMRAYEQMLEAATHNAVNAQTPGFQRQRVVLQSFGKFMDDAHDGRQRLIGANSQITFEQGNLVPDGEPLSLALQGPGFFEIQGPEGETLYTRNGQFTLDADGKLVTQAGYSVVGEGGGPIKISGARGEARIDKTGAIATSAGQLAKLKVVEFADAARANLRPVSETIYAAPPEFVTKSPDSTEVHQGYLEVPQFNGPQALVSMLIAQKNHDAMRRAMAAITDAQERYIRTPN
jgi:flagellar basal-body rod protein FlgF